MRYFLSLFGFLLLLGCSTDSADGPAVTPDVAPAAAVAADTDEVDVNGQLFAVQRRRLLEDGMVDQYFRQRAELEEMYVDNGAPMPAYTFVTDGRTIEYYHPIDDLCDMDKIDDWFSTFRQDSVAMAAFLLTEPLVESNTMYIVYRDDLSGYIPADELEIGEAPAYFQVMNMTYDYKDSDRIRELLEERRTIEEETDSDVIYSIYYPVMGGTPNSLEVRIGGADEADVKRRDKVGGPKLAAWRKAFREITRQTSESTGYRVTGAGETD